MILSDLSVRRPVLATVASLVVVVLGVVSMGRLGTREVPDVDKPTVRVETNYPGAAAAVVETRVTQILEDAISGIEGIETIESETTDGSCDITIEFSLSRDIDNAANDVRDRVSRRIDNLPEECDPPEVVKEANSSDTVYWLNLSSPIRTSSELTDYAERYLVDPLGTVPGVARVRLGGGSRYSMRVWLDRVALAANGITVGDVEQALRQGNVELPAGRVESEARELTVRVQRRFKTPEDFGSLVVGRGSDGHLVRLRDVADVALGATNDRMSFRRNGEDMVGLGITRQSKANTLEVVRAVKKRQAELNRQLPPDMQLYASSDSSLYIQEAILEVGRTLLITAGVVVLVIFLFLGSGAATLVPAVTVPVALIGTLFALDLMGFSINLLTLLALVLAIGLVVDDSIVVLENIARRIRKGEQPLGAAFLGSREVGFAVVATTVVLVAVLVPTGLQSGTTGKLMREFAFTLAAAVVLSTVVALTLSPVLCVALLRGGKDTWLGRTVERGLTPLQNGYRWVLHGAIAHPGAILLLLLGLGGGIVGMWDKDVTPRDLLPTEDRGQFRVSGEGPQGASYDESLAMGAKVEDLLLDYVETGEVQRVLVRVPGGWGSSGDVNSIWSEILLVPWDQRTRTTQDITKELDQELQQIPGYRAYTTVRSALFRRSGQEVQFVLTGPTYDQLAEWRDVVLDEVSQHPGFVAAKADLEETKPQLEVVVDQDRAASLGVTSLEVGRTLESLMGSRRVTTFSDRGEEYDVLLEAKDADKRSTRDLEQIYVRSETTGELVPLANLVSLREFGDSSSRNRYGRLRAITISANLAEGFTLGAALEFLRDVVAERLSNRPGIAYKGRSREFVESSRTGDLLIVISLVLVYLVLAAQFESFLLPLAILLTVPLAWFGGLLGIQLSGGTLNIYSRIALVLLIGLAAKNGILIVEFANQLRDRGMSVKDAVLEASVLRLRPILMTGLSTALGAVPLVLAGGAGAAARQSIGAVVLAGVTLATVVTLIVLPSLYALIGRFTSSPEERTRLLEKQVKDSVAA